MKINNNYLFTVLLILIAMQLNAQEVAPASVFRKEKTEQLSSKYPNKDQYENVFANILSHHRQQLDRTSVDWNLTPDQILRFFAESEKIDGQEAATVIRNSYHPCSITGKLSEDGIESDFIINASGVGILIRSDRTFEFYRATGTADEALFKISEIPESAETEFLLLSQQKDFDCSACGQELCDWCSTWNLSVTDFNKYVALCTVFDSSESLYASFHNYPCALEGQLLWKGQICSYRLESSAALWIWNAVTGDPIGLFGCQDKAGEKYIFEIASQREE